MRGRIANRLFGSNEELMFLEKEREVGKREMS